MALSWRTLREIPRLNTYADASRREAETKPIRGRTPEVKPIGRRNQTYNYIKREENGDIVVGMWQGELVRYRENGDVVIYDSGHWSKASCNEIIQELTGMRVWTLDSKTWVAADGGDYYLRTHKQRVWVHGKGWEPNPDPMPEGNIFRRVEGPLQKWSYVNPPNNVVHHIRRKEMKRVMQPYAAFAAYAAGMDSIRNNERTRPEDYVELFNVKTPQSGWVYWHNEGMPPALRDSAFTHKHAAELCGFMLSTDATDNYKAYLWLNVKRGHYKGPKGPTADEVKHVVTMHHHMEVLKPVEISRATKDRYGWAIPKQNQTT